MTVLQFVNVGKQYQTDEAVVQALVDISFEVSAGEFISIVGRSGCGKTTMLNLAGAMDFATSGKVLLDGVDTVTLDDTRLTAIRRAKTGFVLQFFHLLPTLTVVENVELPLLLAGDLGGRGKAIERLRWVEMEALANRLPHQLSGGQMQRVAIARALVHSPRILLADEPIGNLDDTSAQIVMKLLRRVADEFHTAVLMATHSLEAAALTDKIIQLRDGRVGHIHCPGDREKAGVGEV